MSVTATKRLDLSAVRLGLRRWRRLVARVQASVVAGSGWAGTGAVEPLLVVAEANGDLTSFVRAAQAGEPRAVTTLVRLFGPMVRAIALRVTGNGHDADDAAQQTWLQLLTSVHQVRRPERFPGWLATTAHREALHVLRDRVRRGPPPAGWVGLLPEPAEGPESQVERRELHRIVRDALSALPAEHSRLLLDLVCEQRSYREVSADSGRPIGSLGPARARSLRRLEAELARRGAGISPAPR
jgi:RNA polymerase sigma factor (sigma-70 family)